METNFIREFAESDLPFFDGSMLIWAGIFILISIFLSIVTWRSQKGFGPRALIYWGVNLVAFCLGVYFFTKTFPRLGAGWVLGILLLIIFAISGATVATTGKSEDKKDGKEGDKR